MIGIDNEVLCENPKESLQDAFQKFLQEKRKEKKLQKFLKKNRDNELTKMTLEERRNKFVERCKSYIGIPYHPRYHPDPEDEDHDAPLYLDCWYCDLYYFTCEKIYRF